jgi:uncharacterized membrane protein
MPKNTSLVRPKFPYRLLITGLLCVGVLVASAWFTRPGPGIECARLAPLTVLATIAAFLMAICFRQMARYKERSQRWFLAACLLLAAISLFTEFPLRPALSRNLRLGAADAGSSEAALASRF